MSSNSFKNCINCSMSRSIAIAIFIMTLIVTAVIVLHIVRRAYVKDYIYEQQRELKVDKTTQSTRITHATRQMPSAIAVISGNGTQLFHPDTMSFTQVDHDFANVTTLVVMRNCTAYFVGNEVFAFDTTTLTTQPSRQ
jgi:hypothetical protein